MLSLFTGAQIYSAQINPEDNRNIALYYAVRSGDIQQAQAALDAGANINWQATQEVIDQSFQEFNTPEYLGFFSLHRAVYNNNVEMVRFLLDHNADVNIVDNYGSTSLFLGVRNNNLPMVRLLLAADADVNTVCDERTLFGQATDSMSDASSIGIVQALMNSGRLHQETIDIERVRLAPLLNLTTLQGRLNNIVPAA